MEEKLSALMLKISMVRNIKREEKQEYPEKSLQDVIMALQYNERIRKQVLAMPQHALPPEEIRGSWV